MKELYYLMGAVVVSVFVLGIDFLYAENNSETVTVEEDAVVIPVQEVSGDATMLEGQTPTSAQVEVEPADEATEPENNADFIAVEETVN